MKKHIGKSIIVFLTTLLIVCCGTRKHVVEQWDYEIEPVATGADGSYLIKVWTYGKNPDKAILKAKKYAVHAIAFRGFTGKPGISGQKALVKEAEKEANKEFFTNFFADGGAYQQFATLSNDGKVAASDRLKVGRQYKVGVIVSVAKDALRKNLEEKEIIKPLGYGF